MTYLVPLPVVVPLLGAALTLGLARRPGLRRTVSTLALTLNVVVAGMLLALTTAGGPLVVNIGGWPPPLGIVLVADQLSALLLVVSAAVTLCVLVYSIGEGRADGESGTPLTIYHPTYLVLTAGVANAFLAGDLFNLFVGFELLLAASYVLLTLGATRNRIRAGTTYVVVSLLASILFLVSIGLVYASTGTLNMAQLAGRLDALPDNVGLLLHLMLLLVFGIKAAMFPLSAWLPDSYPTAPAPVTAVFAGLLTKVGVYAIIRTETLLFPGGRLGNMLMVIALLTMMVGILGAIAQSDIKRLLSFTLVSHIGFMVFGVALGTAAGLSGAIYYVAHHITVQTTLFLVAGLIERRGGSTSLDRLGALARFAPLLAILFFVPALSLAGIPPLSGFLGKLGLIQAGVAVGGALPWALVAGSVLTSLLTLYAIMRVWNLAFWRPLQPVRPPQPVSSAQPVGSAQPVSSAQPARGETRIPTPTPAGDAAGVAGRPIALARLPALMVGPTAALVALGVALTILAGPLFDVSSAAAAELLQRMPYVEAVYPGGVP